MRLSLERWNACASVVLVSSVVFESMAVPGVQAHSVQRTKSIGGHPSERPTSSHESATPGLVVKEEAVAVEGVGVVHLPLIRRTIARPTSDRGSTWDVKPGGRVDRKGKEGGRAGSGSTALRDVQDITYNVLVKIGDITTPLVLDTGSSDMWALTDASVCETRCGESSSHHSRSHSHLDKTTTSSPGLSLYPVSALLHTRVRGLRARLVYGDSATGTRAEGAVARDRAGVLGAGVFVEDQVFAAVDYTNTSVRETGAVGILGLGFPISSMLWNELYSAQLAGYAITSSSGTTRRSPRSAMSGTRRLPQVPGSQSSYDQGGQDEDGGDDTQGGRGQDYAEAKDVIPNEFGSRRPAMAINSNDGGRKGNGNGNGNGNGKGKSRVPSVLASFEEFGPLIARLVMRAASAGSGPCHVSMLASPQISISLQRTVFGGAGSGAEEEVRGTLTIGGLPPSPPGSASSDGGAEGSRGQDNPNRVGSGSGSGLTWAPVRLYAPAQGGAMLPEAPREVYPYAWEALMGDVWFNGVKLERSRLGVRGVGVSALIDTGNSLIRGPADVVKRILGSIANASSTSTSTVEGGVVRYPCADAQVLAFEFGGRRFDVDPRDFGSPIYDEDSDSDSEEGEEGEEGKEGEGDGEEVRRVWCTPNLAPTDAPELGAYLYSWSLGDPFLKGVLTSFYYGNITHPSSDPPRVGFVSNVPADAGELLRDEVASMSKSMSGSMASALGANTRDSAPATTRGSNVVNGESTPIPENLFSQRLQPNAGSRADVRLVGAVGGGVLFVLWVGVFRLVG